VAIALIAWGLLLAAAHSMTSMSAPDLPGGSLLLEAAWLMMKPAEVPAYLAVSSLMWVLMMVAMMTPAVLPVVLLFGRTANAGAGRMLAFAAGYLGIWSLYGLALTAVQWALHQAAFLHSMALKSGPLLAAGLLIAAGIYQFLPLKQACLRHCQSPLAFLLNHWRDGRMGALWMGAVHGRYCLGCCWVLMLLMFAGGVMSIGAMAALAVFILLERLLPAGFWARQCCWLRPYFSSCGLNSAGAAEPSPKKYFSISVSRNLRSFASIGVSRYSLMSMVWCLSQPPQASCETSR
jgi:predicted metal-binding membrane protein